MLATGFPAAGERAALPATLVSDTIRLATGKAAAGPVPVSVAILVKEVLRAMIMKKWGAIISALFILGVVSIGASILMPKGGEPQAIATTATVEPSRGRPRDDLEKIQGTWVRVSTNGGKEEITIKMKATKDSDKPQDEIPAGAARFVFEWRPEGHDGLGQKVILDPTQAPKTIDFLTDNPAAPKVCPGIYRLEGDTLTICIRPVRWTHVRRGLSRSSPARYSTSISARNPTHPPRPNRSRRRPPRQPRRRPVKSSAMMPPGSMETGS